MDRITALKRLGWFMRLCIIATLWWLPIGTFFFVNDATRKDTAFTTMMYRTCSDTTDRAPTERFDVENKRCYDRMGENMKQFADHLDALWRDSFFGALAVSALGWCLAWAAYWSVRFILAGRARNRYSVLTMDTDIR